MTTVTDIQGINLALSDYQGAKAIIWSFFLTHRRLFVRLDHALKDKEVYLIAIGCQHIEGPFSWKDAHLYVKEEKEPLLTEHSAIIADDGSGFKLVASGGIVLAYDLEEEIELDRFFTANWAKRRRSENIQNIQPIDRQKAVEIFATNNVDEICHALVAISLHDNDWQWAQNTCLHFFMNSNADISGLAATCLGHIARIHQKIEINKVIPILKSRLGDPTINGQIEDALQDIAIYTKHL